MNKEYTKQVFFSSKYNHFQVIISKQLRIMLISYMHMKTKLPLSLELAKCTCECRFFSALKLRMAFERKLILISFLAFRTVVLQLLIIVSVLATKVSYYVTLL